MKFLYKIHSSYDGFRPAELPNRMRDRRLRLGWRHYIDVVEKGWECWVYFHGPHRFENGVYAKGIVDGIDLEVSEVCLRVREHSTAAPITSRETSERVAVVVAPRSRQVFLWPDDWTVAPRCETTACKERRCGDCETWEKLPLIGEGEAAAPARLLFEDVRYEDVVPAHWIVPRRCYWTRIRAEVLELTKRFTEFKLGEMAYAFPFALSMFEQLRRRDLLQFDYVVPIPLSPDKAGKGEKHRTRELAKELGHLLAVAVREMLCLSSSVSKRRMQRYTPARFEQRYREALQATVPADARRILLVDDVMTRGSTAAEALYAINKQRPEAAVVVATAGQMIVKEAVVDDTVFTSSA